MSGQPPAASELDPGLVRPARWRPDLDDPVRERRQDGDDDESVLRPFTPSSSDDAAWHLVGIGVKNQP